LIKIVHDTKKKEANGKNLFEEKRRIHDTYSLTHYRPAMPFSNRKIYFIGSAQLSIVTIKISPLWKPDIYLFRHFLKLKTAYLNGKSPFNSS